LQGHGDVQQQYKDLQYYVSCEIIILATKSSYVSMALLLVRLPGQFFKCNTRKNDKLSWNLLPTRVGYFYAWKWFKKLKLLSVAENYIFLSDGSQDINFLLVTCERARKTRPENEKIPTEIFIKPIKCFQRTMTPKLLCVCVCVWMCERVVVFIYELNFL